MKPPEVATNPPRNGAETRKENAYAHPSRCCSSRNGQVMFSRAPP